MLKIVDSYFITCPFSAPFLPSTGCPNSQHILQSSKSRCLPQGLTTDRRKVTYGNSRKWKLHIWNYFYIHIDIITKIPQKDQDDVVTDSSKTAKADHKPDTPLDQT